MNRDGSKTMKWSWSLGEFLGIRVYIHATFLLLIGWIGLTHALQGKTIPSILAGVAFTMAIFLCVLFHEYGHALAARKYGIGTRDITLLPIGGLARLERMPEEPRQELWVALAGPAVNLAISGLLYFVLAASGALQPLANLSVTAGPFLERLMVVNIFLALFNMLPAFPMDGGRVLRALLAMRLPHVRATRIAASLGQSMAVLFGFAGLFGNPFLILIAFFIWVGAAQESAAVETRSLLEDVPIGEAMVREFKELAPRDSLSRATEMLLAGTQQDFPVVEEGRLVGILTRADLIRAIAQHGLDLQVNDVMVREYQSADISEKLGTAVERMEACACPAIPVQSSGRLVGLITPENLSEFFMIRNALSLQQLVMAGTGTNNRG
jgi:Zn-dependent protease